MIKLYPHQQEALNQTAGFSNIGIFHDMGLGKTYTGSEAMIRFHTKVNLIVCQKSKIQDWIDHITENYVDKEPFCIVQDLTKTKAQDIKQSLKKWCEDAENHAFPHVYIINYELAWRRKRLLELEGFTLMLDESSLIQNPKAKQTKFILKLKPSHTILLSGTPVGGKYENLWTQSHLLGWKITPHAFDSTYINWRKIEAGGAIHKIVDKEDPYKNVDRLKQKLREHGAVFLKTEEVLDLPDQTFQKILVDRSTEYTKFRKHSIVQVHTGVFDQVSDKEWDGTTYTDLHELTGDTTLTKLLYSRQLCGQYSKEKLQAVQDLIQSTQDRLIIFYNFDQELEKLKNICKTLDRPTSEINGHCKDLTAYEQESNSVTFVQYQAGSKGLNLQKCNRIVYFTLPLSSEHFEQSKKRIHRIGQNKPCFYYLMICRNTIEENILETLEQRRDYTDALFEESDT